jgi:hypothetical protein
MVAHAGGPETFRLFLLRPAGLPQGLHVSAGAGGIDMTTVNNIHAAINPMPAMLARKGKVKPEVEFKIEANAGFSIIMGWKKPYTNNEWEKEYQCFLGDDVATAVGKAMSFIEELPTAEQAKLHHFMGKLGKLIDAGKSGGIDVDYLNPLIDSMKRLSENVLTYQRRDQRSPQEIASE